eukprot:g5016.t1
MSGDDAAGRVHGESFHPVLKPRIMAPTVQNIGLAESDEGGAERAAPAYGTSPSRRNSVKHRIMQFELGSQRSSANEDDFASETGSLRSLKSGKSSVSRIRRQELFQLTLHIPMPDGTSAKHEVNVTRSYDPVLIAREVCHEHGLSYAVMGARIENEVNRLVAVTCLDQTQTFSEELDNTRQVAIDVHSKQKRENIELKKRLLQAKRIIETYDKRVKKLKQEAITNSGKGKHHSHEGGAKSTASDNSRDPAALVAQLVKMKEVYSSELREQRLLSEAETEAVVTQATEQLSKVIQMNEVAYSEEIASMSKKIDAQEKRFEEARELAKQNDGTNIGPDVDSQSVENAVARAREDAFELARDEINTAEHNWKTEHDQKLDALQKKLQAKHEVEIQMMSWLEPEQMQIVYARN